MVLKNMIVEAISKVEKELTYYDIKGYKDCDLSKSTLVNIKLELERMRVIMDKSKYQPSYTRFFDRLLRYILNKVSNKCSLYVQEKTIVSKIISVAKLTEDCYIIVQDYMGTSIQVLDNNNVGRPC